jgi:hypothetical protein
MSIFFRVSSRSFSATSTRSLQELSAKLTRIDVKMPTATKNAPRAVQSPVSCGIDALTSAGSRGPASRVAARAVAVDPSAPNLIAAKRIGA